MKNIQFQSAVGQQAIYSGNCGKCGRHLTFTPGGFNVHCPECGNEYVPKPVEVVLVKPARGRKKGPAETK